MSDLSHERDRLISAVDEFLNSVSDSDYEDIRIDTFAIVAVCTWTTEEGEADAPFQWFEARRHHVQVGVLRTCLLEIEDEQRQGGDD